MKNALIVSKTESGIKAISSQLKTEDFDDVACTLSVDDAREKVRDDLFDLIVINTPLDCETGLEFSVECAGATKASVILIVRQDKADKAFELVAGKGVLVISKPLNKHLFHHYIIFTRCFKERLIPAYEENEKLKSEMEEMKIINRAKLLLIQCLSMTETQAHSYIERQAMNMRKSKLEIAKQVIKTYQN